MCVSQNRFLFSPFTLTSVLFSFRETELSADGAWRVERAGAGSKVIEASQTEKRRKFFVFKSIKTSIEFKLFRVRKFGIAISLFLLKILGSLAVGLQGETFPTNMEASYWYALWRAIKVAIESKLLFYLNVNWGENRKKVINWRSLNNSREHRFTILLNWLRRDACISSPVLSR